jgi:hypothetical protein
MSQLLNNYSFEQRGLVLAELVEGTISMINKYGPLNSSALAYFLNKETKYKYFLRDPEIGMILGYDHGKRLIDPMRVYTTDNDWCIRLIENPNEPARIPSYQDYEYAGAYHELWLRLQTLKENPELINLPETWVDKLLE